MIVPKARASGVFTENNQLKWSGLLNGTKFFKLIATIRLRMEFYRTFGHKIPVELSESLYTCPEERFEGKFSSSKPLFHLQNICGLWREKFWTMVIFFGMVFKAILRVPANILGCSKFFQNVKKVCRCWCSMLMQLFWNQDRSQKNFFWDCWDSVTKN